MLTQEDDVEIHALAKRRWSILAIARHTGRDRKTIRRYLAGQGGAQQEREAPELPGPYPLAVARGVGILILESGEFSFPLTLSATAPSFRIWHWHPD